MDAGCHRRDLIGGDVVAQRTGLHELEVRARELRIHHKRIGAQEKNPARDLYRGHTQPQVFNR